MKRNRKTIDLDKGVLDSISDLKEKRKSGQLDAEMKAAMDAIDIVSNVMESISKGSQIDLAYFSLYAKKMERMLSKKGNKNGVRLQEKKDSNKNGNAKKAATTSGSETNESYINTKKDSKD